MDRVCQYSTIIFAGNVVVLIVVALATDYWRYHSFQTESLLKKLEKADNTAMIVPEDTATYIAIRYFWEPGMSSSPMPTLPANYTYYQPPLLLKRYHRTVNESQRVKVANDSHEIRWHATDRRSQDVLYIFLQYTNLFRDCDDLESK